MKASELMIGDWVMYNPNVFIEDEYEPHKDCESVQIKSGEDIDLAIEGCFAPITLTEEILKANADGGSCSFDEFRSLYHLKSNGYHREISIEFDKTWHVPFVEITGMGHATIKVNMQYAHELQHALRLCGLNELADNFKVGGEE